MNFDLLEDNFQEILCHKLASIDILSNPDCSSLETIDSLTNICEEESTLNVIQKFEMNQPKDELFQTENPASMFTKELYDRAENFLDDQKLFISYEPLAMLTIHRPSIKLQTLSFISPGMEDEHETSPKQDICESVPSILARRFSNQSRKSAN